MNIATGSIMDWETSTTNPSDLSRDERSVNMVAVGADTTYIYKRVPANPGETITVKIRAKVTSGQAAIFLDYPAVGQKKVTQLLDVGDWQWYEASYSVNDASTKTDFFQLAIGFTSSYSGEVDISDITITSTGSKLPVARCYCAALLTINQSGAGNISANRSFATIGVDEDYLLAQTVTNQVYVKVPFVYGGTNAHSAPIFSASLTHDNGSTLKVAVKVGGYNRDTGIVLVKFIDMTTGALINISGLGVTYLWITGFGV